MYYINKAHIKFLALIMAIATFVIVGCTQDDNINGTQEHSEELEAEYSALNIGDRELLELRSALHGRKEQLVIGYQKGINYKDISWERARIKKEQGRDIIFVPFRTNKKEGALTYLNYIRSFKNQKKNNVPPVQLFIYKFDATRNLKIYSLSNRLVAVKKVREGIQDVTRHLLRGGDEDFWHLGGNLDEVVITAPGGSDTPPPVWDPCADGLCGGNIDIPPVTDPYQDYPDCYYSGGCGGGTTSNPSTNNNNDDYNYRPDKHSFNFKTRGNWQSAAVTGLYFHIALIKIDPKTGVKIEYKQTIVFKQAILFGMPANLSIGNIDIDNKLAAEVTANAINNVMKETSQKFARTNSSSMQVEQYFRTQLTRQYSLHIPGGRVQFNAMNFTDIPTPFRHE
ncbi:hypothetical protein MHTCC0001_23480 [Flavobacteriaceae bacterium MHTCC 0001]